ncbi:E3 ubiquitin-protein ligase [Cricetulus griseus]|uniref:E3 ubiquitin-protein ligase n=1 Tax=Cricetulus griseus TaxID=10029 RepID=A0A061I6Y6_CRIGR|nr:E3 ubiquitin-protein ligase [Cricetulus griseus]
MSGVKKQKTCKGVRSPGTGVTDSCELPCGCWELNRGPLEELPVDRHLGCFQCGAVVRELHKGSAAQ